jgi:hypothetical protein
MGYVLIGNGSWFSGNAISGNTINLLSVTNVSGSTVSNYPFVAILPVKSTDISSAPSLSINGSAITTASRIWATDINSAPRTVLVAGLISSLSNGTVSQVSLTSGNTNGSGLNKAGIQALIPSGNSGATINLTYSGGGSDTISLRDMIDNDKYEVVLSGTACTIIRVFDRTGGYNKGPLAGVKPFVPQFWVYMWSSGSVWVHCHGNHGSTIALQQLSYALSVYVGGTQIFNQSSVSGNSGASWVYEGWIGSAPTVQVNKQINRQYFAECGVTPRFSSSSTTLEQVLSAWYSGGTDGFFSSTHSGIPSSAALPVPSTAFSPWEIPTDITAGGANNALYFVEPNAQAINGGDWRAWECSKVVAQQSLSRPTFFIEFDNKNIASGVSGKSYYVTSYGRPTQRMLGADQSINLFIRDASISNTDRMTWYDSFGTVIFGSGVSANTTYSTATEANSLTLDCSHMYDPFSMVAVSGRLWAADAIEGRAAWTEMQLGSGSNGPNGTDGLMYGDAGFGALRACAWSLRQFIHSAMFTASDSPMHTRHKNVAANLSKFYRGVKGITGQGDESSSFYTFGSGKRSVMVGTTVPSPVWNTLGSWSPSSSVTPGGFWGGVAGFPASSFWVNATDYSNPTKTHAAATFMESYWIRVLYQAKNALQGVGFDLIHRDAAVFFAQGLGSTEGSTGTFPSQNDQSRMVHGLQVTPITNPSDGSYKTTRLSILNEFTSGYNTGSNVSTINVSLAGDFYYNIGIIADSYGMAAHGPARLARAALAHCVEATNVTSNVTNALSWLSQFDAPIASSVCKFTRCNKLDMQMGSY